MSTSQMTSLTISEIRYIFGVFYALVSHVGSGGKEEDDVLDKLDKMLTELEEQELKCVEKTEEK